MKTLIFVTSLFLLSLSNAFATKLEIIRDHSKIQFGIDYMLMTTVDGVFKEYSGEFELNEAETDIKNINITVKGKSVDTNDKKRDFHLRGHEFFFVAKYPNITFTSPGPFKIESGKKMQISGYLTMRGITRPFILEGIYKGKHKDPWDKDNYFFELSGELDRKSYDIEWNKMMDNGGLLIGEKVRVSIVVQAQVKGGKTPFSTHMVPTTKGIVERDLMNKGKLDELSTQTGDEKVKVEEPKKK